MIDLDKELLAQQTVAMGASIAFLDLLDGLKAQVEEVESGVLHIGADKSDEFSRNAFIKWQALKEIVSSIETSIKNAAECLKATEEEREYERSVERDRTSRGGW